MNWLRISILRFEWFSTSRQLHSHSIRTSTLHSVWLWCVRHCTEVPSSCLSFDKVWHSSNGFYAATSARTEMLEARFWSSVKRNSGWRCLEADCVICRLRLVELISAYMGWHSGELGLTERYVLSTYHPFPVRLWWLHRTLFRWLQGQKLLYLSKNACIAESGLHSMVHDIACGLWTRLLHESQRIVLRWMIALSFVN